jgi:hypothetical protein
MPFAKRVAEVLRGLSKGASLVVGIHGPWGDGKTSVLNMLRLELQGEKYIVVREFNPWRLADEESMLRGFFGMLAEAINKSLATELEKANAAAYKWTKLSRWVTRPLGWFWKPAESLDDLLAKIGEIAASSDIVTLDVLRGRINEHLMSSDKRIVVLVDDIDRLDKHETYTLFRLIKACANFPNVCYVLAFDEVAVAQTLAERYGAGDHASGRAFLEKVIQVPLKLPVAMREDLLSLCFQQVEQAINAAEIELTQDEKRYFGWQFDSVISTRHITPRASMRYGNGLLFALPILKGEVNTVDLLLIEAVRTFYPPIYEIIRANHVEYSGEESGNSGQDRDSPPAVALLDPVIEKYPSHEQEAIKSLLGCLFPKLGRAFRKPYVFNHNLDGRASPRSHAKRVASSDYCPRYFSYSIPKNDVRESEMEALYAMAAKGSPEVDHKVRDIFMGGRAIRCIAQMREREKSTPPETVTSLCLAIALNAKHIPNPSSVLRADSPVSQAAILISYLIERLPAGEQRVTLAKQLMQKADPLWFGGDVFGWLRVAGEQDKADQNTLTQDELMEVGQVLVERIKARAIDGEPLFSFDNPQETDLLYEWSRVEGREPVQAHLSSIFATEPTMIGLFLQAMAPRSWSADSDQPRVGERGVHLLQKIKPIYDLDALYQMIHKHLLGDRKSPKQYVGSDKPLVQRLGEQYIAAYNDWKKSGEPPERG